MLKTGVVKNRSDKFVCENGKKNSAELQEAGKRASKKSEMHAEPFSLK